MGGYEITDALFNSLNELYTFTTTAERMIVDDIKQKHVTCHSQVSQDISYELPDGNIITIPARMIESSTSPLFSSSNYDPYSLIENYFSSLTCIPEDLRKQLPKCTIICGGNAQLQGLSSRFLQECNSFLPDMVQVPYWPQDKHTDYQVYKGLKEYASFSTCAENAISLQEYNENGSLLCIEKLKSLVQM